MGKIKAELGLAKLVKNAGDKSILSVVDMWYPFAKNEHDGHRWLIKTAKEFQDDGVPFAEKTIWNIVARLVKRGLLISVKRPHPHRAYANSPVLWLRPNLEFCTGQLKLLGEGTSNCPEGEPQSALSGQFLYKTDTDTYAKAQLPAAAAEQQEKEEHTVDQHTGKGAKLMQAKQAKAGVGALAIQQAAQGIKPKILSKDVTKGSELYNLFIVAYREEYKISPGEGNKIRYAMFNKLMARITANGVSDPKDIKRYLFAWVAGWEDFRNWCKAELNLSVKGARPNASDMTKYCLEAVGWWQEREAALQAIANQADLQKGPQKSSLSGSGGTPSPGYPSGENAPQKLNSGWLSGGFGSKGN